MPTIITSGAGSVRGFGFGAAGALYPFTSFTFTNATITGPNGPTLANCQSAYAGAAFLNGFFTVPTQGYQTLIVPATGTYQFTVAGAAGRGTTSGQGPRDFSARGRIIQANLSLVKGESIVLIVGQFANQGTFASGGSGGSFVVKGGVCQIAAGGAGGNGNLAQEQFGEDGGGIVTGASTGGARDQGGGGAGFGANASGSFNGKSFANGFTGGPASSGNFSAGGFGGGGGGAGDNGGGGGGGWNGGNGSGSVTKSGGGSSYVLANNGTEIGFRSDGAGYITMTKI